MESTDITPDDATPTDDDTPPQSPGGDTDHVVEEKGEDTADDAA